ncbi:hypothetical protein [Thiomicrorhabdus heinhorstiae]|uniref:FAD-binding FR-type domain-containing protein n=1 Tax=Thiomicrorhabdus heinhorstiae TaxID=2748010 RepID=A0ABS0BVF6_9GAMM|nr:hypothetical protein [Thiomicrorhabdus heinhorstiae]MBF6057808.1 hypothetical protein [Thiomicrorhabdus heinhorstiae]
MMNLPEWQSFNMLELRQSEQLNGYYLIEFKLAVNAPFGWKVQFRLAADPQQQLALFKQQQQQNYLLLQLLSDRPLNDIKVREILVKEPPEIALPPNDTTLMMLGSGLQMVRLFGVAKQRSSVDASTLALLHSTDTFAFPVKPARFIFPNTPAAAIGACPLLEDWKVPNRLASDQGLPGCYDGNLPELLQTWLEYSSVQDWQFILAAPDDVQQECISLLETHGCRTIFC